MNDRKKLLYFLLVLINLIPLFASWYYPTMDGAAHTYNAKLISSKIFGNYPNIQQFYAFTTDPVPNWTGHILLICFQTIFPAWLAEKLLLIILISALPLAVYSIIKIFRPEEAWTAILVLPFTYSGFFSLGFYNFSLALPAMIFTAGIWYRFIQGEKQLKYLLLMSILFTYFSHVFVFAFLVLLLGMITIALFFQQSQSKKIEFKVLLNQLLQLFGFTLLPLMLMLWYFIKRPETGEKVYLAVEEIKKIIYQVNPLIMIDILYEQIYNRYYVVPLLLIVILGLINEIRTKNWIHLPWFILSFLSLFLTFYMPDMSNGAGYITPRMVFLFLLMACVFVVLANSHVYIKIGFCVLTCFVMFKKDVHYFKNQHVIQNLATEIAAYEKHIQADAIVLPLNYHEHWQSQHLSNYLGAQKPMVILENYEAGNSYFPLRWNEGWYPMIQLGSLKSGDVCKNWQSNPYGNAIQPDFVFIYGKMPQDSCAKRIEVELKNHFISVQKTENCELFKKKPKVHPKH